MRNEFPKFGDRLDYLMKNHNPPIENAYALSRALYASGVMSHADVVEKQKEKGVKTTDNERIGYAARSIDNHLHYASAESLTGVWLKRYCDFFQCEPDFLFGYIDKPTHAITDISAETGLSEKEINAIINIKSSSQRTDKKITASEMLEYTLTDGSLYKFMDFLGMFIDFGYDTPLTYDNRKLVPIRDWNGNKENCITIGKETLDNKGNPGYNSWSFPVNELSDLWFTRLQAIIFKWKDAYKDKEEKES